MYHTRKKKLKPIMKNNKKDSEVKKVGLTLELELKGRTPNQAEYIRNIAENSLVICTGPAGTGKTCIAVGLEM